MKWRSFIPQQSMSCQSNQSISFRQVTDGRLTTGQVNKQTKLLRFVIEFTYFFVYLLCCLRANIYEIITILVMNKLGSDPKVKKTLVRNSVKRIKPPVRNKVVHDVAGCSSKVTGRSFGSSQKENELNEPTLCSSEALANYLSEIKLSSPPIMKAEELNVDKSRNIKVSCYA